MTEEYSISSVNEMLTKLNFLREKYVQNKVSCWDGYRTREKIGARFAYRGISNKDFRLRPRVLNEKICDVDNNFREPLLKFQREASSYLRNICEKDELMWMLYAQHYGVPTRLLDLSTNPMVALYFACQDAQTDGALWVINVDTYEFEKTTEYMHFNELSHLTYDEHLKAVLDSEDEEYIAPIYITPEYIHDRMNAQSSRFLLWSNKRFDLEDIIANDYMSLTIPDENEYYREYAVKFIIPKSCKSRILFELDLLDVNEKKLFPGLDSIGKYVNYLYS